VVQADSFNRSALGTVLCVPLTSNLKWGAAPGNAVLSARSTGLAKDSVANVTQLLAVDKSQLTEQAGRISHRQLALLFAGLDIVLGR
jgi:mRNA interferase MazF